MKLITIFGLLFLCSFCTIGQQTNTNDSIQNSIIIIKAGCSTPYVCAAGADELSEEKRKQFKKDSKAYLDSTGTSCEFIFTTESADDIKLLSLEFGGFTYSFDSKAIFHTGDTIQLMTNEKKNDFAIIQNRKKK